MNILLVNLCNSLDDISATVKASWGQEARTMSEVIGWPTPALTKFDLALLAERLSSDIKNTNMEEIDDSDLQGIIAKLPQQLQALKAQVIPQMFNGGNSYHAVQAYVATISAFRNLLDPILNRWDRVDDPGLMPHKIAKRVRSLQAQLTPLEPQVNLINSQIKIIQEARETAELLPTELEDLKQAKEQLGKINKESNESAKSIASLLNNAKKEIAEISKNKETSENLVKQLNELHRIGTSTALAGVFDNRAKSLNNSLYLWVVILIVALTAGAYIGIDRLKTINELLANPATNMTAIWVNCLLSMLSLGGPIWLAWIATKQIGQRFRLAEDYAYKASISNAYEGYRREAIHLDEEFQARLFGSALSRFDEVPLRLVEKDAHGSPLHEFLNSAAFKKAIESSSELKDAFITSFKEQPEKVKNVISKAVDKILSKNETGKEAA